MIRARKSLVTGATGLLGNNVVRRLLANGAEVRVLQRATSDPRALAGLDVEIMHGDVRDAEAVKRACQGVEQVIHAAGHVHIGWSGNSTHQAINVEGTRNVTAGALASGARLVYVSSVDTLGFGTLQQPANEDTPSQTKHPIPYQQTKRAAEEIVLAAVAQSLSAMIVHPAYIIGPWDWKPSSGRMLLEIANGRGIFVPRGGNDFCDARDVADGILAAAERGQPGRHYILGGEGLSYFDFWKLIGKMTGTPASWMKIDRPIVVATGWVGDLLGRITGHEPVFNSAAMQLSAQPHHFSYARAESELGYAPRPAREALADSLNWFAEHGYLPARKAPNNR